MNWTIIPNVNVIPVTCLPIHSIKVVVSLLRCSSKSRFAVFVSKAYVIDERSSQSSSPIFPYHHIFFNNSNMYDSPKSSNSSSQDEIFLPGRMTSALKRDIFNLTVDFKSKTTIAECPALSDNCGFLLFRKCKSLIKSQTGESCMDNLLIRSFSQLAGFTSSGIAGFLN